MEHHRVEQLQNVKRFRTAVNTKELQPLGRETTQKENTEHDREQRGEDDEMRPLTKRYADDTVSQKTRTHWTAIEPYPRTPSFRTVSWNHLRKC